MRAPQIGFPQLVQDFFLRRLIQQRGVSARTVESYRDAFELLFSSIEQRLGKSPSAIELADLDAPLVLDFLDHLSLRLNLGPFVGFLCDEFCGFGCYLTHLSDGGA